MRSSASRILHAAALTTLLASPSACSSAPVLNGSATLGVDDGGRYTTPVTLNGAGPFAFIVDTGAQASVMLARTSAKLNLHPTGSAQIIGASGRESSGFVSVADYRSGMFARRDESMVVIPNGTVTNADGVLGMNAFVSGRIELGFAKRMLTVGPSGPAPKGFLVQSGGVRQGSFMVVDVVVDGVRAKAMVDTGGRRTVGNPALQAALGIKADDARLQATDSIGGATTQKTAASKAVLGEMTIGAAVFSKPMVTFADLPVFHSLGLDDGPAMIVGIDEFSRLQAMAIDYPRKELQLLQ